MHLNIRLKRLLAGCLVFAFLGNGFIVPSAYAQVVLPAPGQMVSLSKALHPPVLKGIKVFADKPFAFDFVLSQGDSTSAEALAKADISRLIRYFLAGLTVPEGDLWVNLSPYERNRIVPQEFGQTEMGRDLLAQDYILKQITASVIYPESATGKQFWAKVYAQA